MENPVSLSTNGIPYILSFQTNKKAYTEPIIINECILKIEAFQIKASAKGDFLLLSLTDGVNNCNTFVIQKKENKLQIGDIIKISSIIFMKLQNNIILIFIRKIDHLYSNNTTINNSNNINKIINNNKCDMSKYNSLSSLTSFTRSFRIYIAIISKNEIRTFKNSLGENKLLTFIMRDKDGFEMQGVCFGNACEKVNKQINTGNFYETTSGIIRSAIKRGCSNFSEYSILFFEDAIFKQMPPLSPLDDSQILLHSIKDIQELYLNAFINILGVVIKQGEIYPMKIRKNNSLQNTKAIIIGDEAGEVIELKIWGDKSNYNYEKGSIFLFTKLRVSEFRNIKYLNTTEDSVFISNPKIPRIEKLKQFISKKGNFSQIKKTYSLAPISDLIQGEKLFLNQIYARIEDMILYKKSKIPIKKPTIVKFEATIVYIPKSDKNYYYGCPNQNCKRKLKIVDNRNIYRCTNCNYDIKDNEGSYYYTIYLKVRDCTMESDVNVFGDTAENLIGINCHTYHEHVMNKNDAAINEINKKILNKKYLFVGQIKKKLINDYLYETFINILHAVEIKDEIQMKLTKEKINFIKSLKLINH